MASTLLATQKTDHVNGIVPSFLTIDTANGNKFLNRSGKIRLRFKGATSAVGQLRIIQQKKNQDGAFVHPTSDALALDAGTKEVEFGPFPDRWVDGDGFTHIDYSPNNGLTGILTNVTVALVEDADPPAN